MILVLNNMLSIIPSLILIICLILFFQFYKFVLNILFKPLVICIYILSILYSELDLYLNLLKTTS